MILNVIDDCLKGVTSSGLGCALTELTLSPMAFHSMLTDMRLRYLKCDVAIDSAGHFYFVHRGVKIKCLMSKIVEGGE